MRNPNSGGLKNSCQSSIIPLSCFIFYPFLWIPFMIGPIEQIVQADEAARELVAVARLEAERIQLQAEKTARETISTGFRESNEAVRIEREAVLANARSQAARIIAESDSYIDGLQQKRAAVQTDLIENLLKKVVGK